MIFSADGAYLGGLSRRGRGPGEYLELQDFEVDDRFIHVLSTDNRKIIRYDMDDFYREPSEVNLPEASTKISVSGGGYWLGDTFTEKGLWELAHFNDGEVFPFFEVRKKLDNTMRETPLESKPQVFFSSGNYALFNQRFTGDVYQLVADSAELLLRAISRLPASGSSQDEHSFNGFYSIHRAGDLLFGQLWGGTTDYPFFFAMNLDTGTASLLGFGDLGLPGIGTMASTGGRFVTLVPSRSLMREEVQTRLADLVDTRAMSEDDNPVAVVFTLVEKTE